MVLAKETHSVDRAGGDGESHPAEINPARCGGVAEHGEGARLTDALGRREDFAGADEGFVEVGTAVALASAFLDAALSKEGNNEPADDRCENTDGRREERGGAVNRYTRDSEGKCEGESDQADGDAGERVGDRLGSGGTRTQAMEDRRLYF